MAALIRANPGVVIAVFLGVINISIQPERYDHSISTEGTHARKRCVERCQKNVILTAAREWQIKVIAKPLLCPVFMAIPPEEGAESCGVMIYLWFNS